MLVKIRRGFSIIELLVVIGIIALLVAILLPSLASARQQARTTVCLSNLKQLGTQTSVYLNKYGGFPPVRLNAAPNSQGVYVEYAHDFHRGVKRRRPRWHWFIAEDLGPVIDPDKYSDENAFNASLILDNAYFEDPAMTGFSHDERNGAYGYNGVYLGNARTKDTNSDGVMDAWIRFPVVDTSIVDPSQTVLLGDSRGGAAPHGQHSYWLDPPKKAVYGGDPATAENAFGPDPAAGPMEILGHSPVEARHQGRGNVAFVDAHAESMTLPSLGYQMSNENPTETALVADLDRTQAHNKLWAGTGRDDPFKEFLYPTSGTPAP